jgi:hypothetical protein
MVVGRREVKIGIAVNAACHFGHMCHRLVSPGYIQCDTQHAVGTSCKVLQLGVHVPAGFAERLSAVSAENVGAAACLVVCTLCTGVLLVCWWEENKMPFHRTGNSRNQ